MVGVIERLKPKFGFVRGEDGVQYFFIPSCLRQSERWSFDELVEGCKLEFEPFKHPRGPRAVAVRVLYHPEA